jgi:glycogen(starch) synthase
MRVFMLGWEFPPFISGGLGTACYGLTRGLDRLGVQVLFVLPKAVDTSHTSHVQIVAPGRPTPAMERRRSARSFMTAEFRHVKFRSIDAELQPYLRPEDAEVSTAANAVGGGPAGTVQWTVDPVTGERRRSNLPPALSSGPGGDYAGNLFEEIEKYAELVQQICEEETFDVIHAHDWMTFKAGIRAADLTGKPLVVHVHSTEFDRSGIHVDQRIYDIERAGMHRATRVIAVSFLTRNLIQKHFGVDPRKIDVVYNAIDENGGGGSRIPLPPIARDEKIVLFLGRITMQKGPEFFLAAAKRVLEVMSNVRFIMAGSGDLIQRMIRMAQEMGIGDKVLFTGFLRGEDVKRVFRMADLYVMPSVSEPFGIAPLEALANDVPVLISKQSGVAEVLQNALKVDFWDVDEMANKIVAVLRHPPLQATLRDHGSIEVRRLSWTDSAESLVEVYRKALAGGNG